MTTPIITTVEVDKKAFKSRAYEYDWLVNHGFKVKPHHDVGDDRYYQQTSRKTNPNKEDALLVPMKAQPEAGLKDPSHVVFVVEAPAARAKRVPKLKEPSVVLAPKVAPKVPIPDINADLAVPKQAPVKSVKQPSKIRKSTVLIEGSTYYDLNKVKKGFFNKVGVEDVIDIVNTIYPKTKDEIEAELNKRSRNYNLIFDKIKKLYTLFELAAIRADVLSRTKPEPEERTLILSLIRKLETFSRDLGEINDKAKALKKRSVAAKRAYQAKKK